MAVSPTPRDGLLPWLVQVALVVIVFELVILRTATRVAIHIPGIDRAAVPYRAAAESGRFAYYLAVVLVITALGLAMRAALQHGHHAVATALAVFVGAAFLARAGAIDDLLLAVAVVASFGLVAVGCAAADRRLRPALFLFGGGFLLGGLYVVAQQAAARGLRPVEASPWLLVAAETLVLAAPMALVYSRTRMTSGAAVAWGAAVSGAVMMTLVLAPATAKIVLLWNFGLAGYLPALAYAMAAGTLTYALVMIVKSGDGLTAVGIGLLVVGGIGLHSTYQSALVILGLSVLVFASEVPERATALVRPVIAVER